VKKQAAMFLNEAVAKGRHFPHFDKAEILFNLAEFELSNNRNTFVGSDDDKKLKGNGNDKYPLVSIERKLRQAMSLLSPLISAHDKDKNASVTGAAASVLALASNICYCLAKLLHLHKGVIGMDGVVGDDDGVHSCSEALRLYEKAREYVAAGERAKRASRSNTRRGNHKAFSNTP